MKADKNIEKLMDLAIEMKTITTKLCSDLSTINPEDEALRRDIGIIDDMVCNLMRDVGDALGQSVFWLAVDEANEKGRA